MADRPDKTQLANRIYRIFDQALDFEDSEKRDQFIRSKCEDTPLVFHAVNDLLSAHFAANSLLDSMQLPSPPMNRVTNWIGRRVDDYTIVKKLGEGGFGQVFVATQAGPEKKKVALKMLKPGMNSREVLSRFELEKNALKLMDAPGIAKVLDAGITDAGTPYFVMELISGKPLTKFCDDLNLGTIERIRIFIDVCRAMQHAHQKGVIHRDIKPSNILVVEQEQHYQPKIIDFGIAKAINQQLIQHSIYTRFSEIIGTPLYMSPEQAGPRHQSIDTRSDIYSLGVVLYELLTGSTPTPREHVKQLDHDELFHQIREIDPPKPSQRLDESGKTLKEIAGNRSTEPSRLSRSIRGDVDWIVMKALEKDRDRRYPSASDLADDLERFLNDEKVIARPPSRVYRVQKLYRKNKRIVMAVVGIAFVLLLATTISLWQFARTHQAKRRALNADAKISDSLNAESLARQKEIAARKNAERSTLELSQLLRHGNTKHIRDDLLSSMPPVGEATESQIQILKNVAIGMIQAREFKKADDLLNQILREELKRLPEISDEIIKTQTAIADIHARTGDSQKAESSMNALLAKIKPSNRYSYKAIPIHMQLSVSEYIHRQPSASRQETTVTCL